MVGYGRSRGEDANYLVWRPTVRPQPVSERAAIIGTMTARLNPEWTAAMP
jgi:hypothetical protein